MESVFPRGDEQFRTRVDDNSTNSNFRYKRKKPCITWGGGGNQEGAGTSGARGRIVQEVTK